ncbi:MAG: hypothetical protein AB198_00385 [Parcubacteria bacterium C7867-003]|nr:MAG: hypothetical protein AB198_00385 [Parcubacteria bacterium C7867-003]
MFIFKHPEAEDDEVFITNSNEKVFNQMSWVTKRKGKVALDGNGLMTNNDDWFPVFIGKKELESSEMSIKDIRGEIRRKIEDVLSVVK